MKQNKTETDLWIQRTICCQKRGADEMGKIGEGDKKVPSSS